jgi:hypothetical protein
MAGGELAWLPPEGTNLTREDLERIARALRAIVQGTSPMDPNRLYALEIAAVLADAMRRSAGGS